MPPGPPRLRRACYDSHANFLFFGSVFLEEILLKVALRQFRNVILLVFTYGYNFNCKNMIFELILSLAKS